jgi:hypothetical protein
MKPCCEIILAEQIVAASSGDLCRVRVTNLPRRINSYKWWHRCFEAATFQEIIIIIIIMVNFSSSHLLKFWPTAKAHNREAREVLNKHETTERN